MTQPPEHPAPDDANPDDLPFAQVVPDPTSPYRQGELIVAPSGAFLGDACIVCGGEGDGHLLTARLTSDPAWSKALGVLSILGAVISLAVTRRGKVVYCLCPRHRRSHRFWQRAVWISGAAALALILAVAYFASNARLNQDTIDITLYSAIAFFAIAAVLGVSLKLSKPLKATEIDAGTLRIKGASAAFLRTLPDRVR